MDSSFNVRRLGGALLALGGAGFFLAGALHPQPSAPSQSFPAAMATMLAGPSWYAAHWLAVVSTLLLVWSIWSLLDAQWTHGAPMAQAGARLVLLGGLFMAVEFAVELATAPEAAAFSSGQPTPQGRLVEAMQAVGWPAFMLGFVMLIAGLPSSAPAVVRLAGVVGASAFGVGGVLTEGLHIVAAGLLFGVGNLLAIWIVWAGVALARQSATARVGDRRQPAFTT